MATPPSTRDQLRTATFLEGVRLLERAGGGTVRRFVEQDPLAHRLARTERGQALRPAARLLLDGHDPFGNDGQHAARISFLEEEGAGREGGRLHDLGEPVEGGLGDAFQEGGGAELVAGAGGGGHGAGKVGPSGGGSNHRCLPRGGRV